MAISCPVRHADHQFLRRLCRAVAHAVKREDIVKANADYQKTLESKGLVFNTTQAEAFQATLAKTSFYKDAKAKFGEEAWTLLQKYAGNIG
jgi:hypothetical protein